MSDASQSWIEEPYWWEQARPGAGTDGEPPSDTDALIIGSGYTGLCCALELARAGTDVTVVEALAIGGGASSRAAGFLSGRAGVSKQINLTKAVGAERAAAILDEADDAYEHLKDRIRTEQIDCDLETHGRFVGAHTLAAYRKLAAKMSEYEAGAPGQFEMIPEARQDEWVRTKNYRGGMALNNAGLLHPAKYHAGLVRLCRDAGVKLISGCRVDAIVQEPAGFRAVTAKGDIRARKVASGTNGYTDGALPWHRRRIVPISSSIIATEPVSPDLVRHLLPGRSAVIDTRRVLDLARPSPDGTRVLFGGRASFFPVTAERKVGILQRNMVRMFPELEGVAVTHLWGGWMGFTFDFLPKLGVQDGVHYALGCNGGSGIVMMSWLGHQMAGEVLGRANRKSAFSGLPFRSQPLYRGKPWFLPVIGNWYRVRDWLDLRLDRA